MKFLITIIILFVTTTIAQSNEDVKCDSLAKYEFCIISDSTTVGNGFDKSFRKVKIKVAGETILEKTLDINISHDFPYKFNMAYVETLGILIIEGANGFYLYNLNTQKLTPRVVPDKGGCEITDQQGTFIIEYTIDPTATTLIVKVMDCGYYTFKLNELF